MTPYELKIVSLQECLEWRKEAILSYVTLTFYGILSMVFGTRLSPVNEMKDKEIEKGRE